MQSEHCEKLFLDYFSLQHRVCSASRRRNFLSDQAQFSGSWRKAGNADDILDNSINDTFQRLYTHLESLVHAFLETVSYPLISPLFRSF